LKPVMCLQAPLSINQISSDLVIVPKRAEMR
jgi:hypothetical protein